MTFQTYNVGTPAASNNPSVDQPNMLTNTNSIPTLFAQDHFGFNNNAGGNHKWVHLKNTSAPGGLGANANAVFYANTAAGQSWPFWQNALGSFQMMGAVTNISPGSVVLPGGIILKWGSITGTPIVNGATASFAGGSFTTLFAVTLGGITNSTNDKTINMSSATTSGFTVSTSGSSSFQTLYYIAVGV